MSDGIRSECQWIEVGVFSLFVTAMVTVSPSFHRKIGPGTEPFTAVATERFPVKFTGIESMVSSKWVPESIGGV
jgi:hypothetical protein